ncbi:lysoplasmalogenase family protein [Novosphingobium sp.]|uniref:lysoplasmalogenase family protein n=1 Tax=Novosphingobium sp. TaxID=1874826 RepID=UPI00333EA643
MGGKYAWLIISLIFGIGYWACQGVLPPGPIAIAVKMGGVAALGVHAWRLANRETRSIALVLALGALGDGLIELSLIAGAVAFLAGHVIAIAFYWRMRRAVKGLALFAPPLLGMIVLSDAAYAISGGDLGVGFYAMGLGAMLGCAWLSDFSRSQVALGALLFAVSDLLLFARMGGMAGSAVPGMLVWPLYYAGQLLITLGVVGIQGRTTPPSASRTIA